MTYILLYLTLSFVTIALAFWIFRLFRKQKIELQSKKAKIELLEWELQRIKDEIFSAYAPWYNDKKKYKESLEAAERVQKLFFFNTDKIQDFFKNSIVYQQPKEIVSGDFYWTKYFDNKLYIALGDATGHGVPGVFMSLLGLSIVKEELNTVNLLTKPPATYFLTKIRKNLLTKFRELDNHKVFEHKFDMSFCILDLENYTVQFAGANTSIIHIKNGIIKEYKGEKLPIGIYKKDKEYKNHEFEFKNDDLLYLYSDGYVSFDKNNKKFTKNRFRQLLLDMSSKEMSEQKTMLDKQLDFSSFKQLDDFLLIGIKANSSEKEEHNKIERFVSKGITPDPEMGSKFNSIQKIVINNPLYEFTGNLNNQAIKSILEDYEKLIVDIGSNRFKRRSIHVLLELLQNSEVHNVNNTEIKLFVQVFNGKLFYMCENDTNTPNVSTLTKRINKLNAMSGEELKVYLKSKLIHSPLSPKPGKMGIGLIDIVRKSNNKILYKFTEIDDKSSLVSLITTIDIK